MPKEPISNFLGLGENMPRLNLYLAGAAVLMGVAVWALLRFSRFGLATRAADENEKGASLLGYSPQRLAGLNWVLSAAARRHRRPAVRRERLARHDRLHRSSSSRPSARRCSAA